MNPDFQPSNINTDGELGVALVSPSRTPKKSGLIWIILVLIILALSVVGLVFRDKLFSTKIEQPTVAQPEDPILSKLIKPTTGETWLAEPKAITAQGWLRVEDSAYFQKLYGTLDVSQYLKDNLPTYTEVGARGENSIILVYSMAESAEGVFWLFERRPNGQAVMMASPQQSSPTSEEQLAYIREMLTAKVAEIDQTTHYDSLDVPAKLALGHEDYAYRPKFVSLGMSEQQLIGSNDKKTLITKLGQSSLYKIESTNADTNLTNIGYYIQTPLNTMINLDYEPNQLSLDGYKFENNILLKENDKFDNLTPIAQGCGGVIGSVTRSDTLKDTDLKAVGQTNTGQTVYALTDQNHILYQKAYAEYKDSQTGNAVTLADYITNHGLVLIKNSQDELLVYVREKYAPVYGCAKPVIYLYPEVETKVDVVVGAKVAISDPFYPVGGWREVWARPDGHLTYRGKSYDSLFWEGLGYGRYPAITSGIVVKQVDALATIRRQLLELGLNTKESDDFIEFWADKIPQKPYVRLTWFGTDELERLAPLKITPKPDTVIRVFLDMAGFDAPLHLPAQKLTAVPRRGFTVVEWGGLTSIQWK